MYLNGCFNFNNFSYDFTDSGYPTITTGYFIEFWFKLDPINEFCVNPVNGKKYIFIAYPHAFYILTSSSTQLQYEYMGSSPGITGVITAMTTADWNYIILDLHSHSFFAHYSAS